MLEVKEAEHYKIALNYIKMCKIKHFNGFGKIIRSRKAKFSTWLADP
jgi:hypothetical protein